MAVVAEFISVLRKIRDIIYPEVNALYEDSLVLKESINVGKAEFDADLIQFNTDYSDFNTKKNQVDVAVASAQSSATSANNSAIIATNKSNEIKAITAQSTTGAPGTSASASYNTTDGKFTFVIPQGSKGDKGDSFTVNSSGVTASRTLYDNQPTGWSFLDVATSLLYFKQSNATADWSSGVPFGKGDKGDTGDTGVGIESFTYISTNHTSGLPAQSGGTDTYSVTLTNALTFEYQVYNGLDYSQELLDSKLDKDFSDFTDEATPIDTDVFPIMKTSEIIKKLSWSNIKATLKAYFDTLYATPAYVDGKMVLGTVVNATGTAVDFIGIPSWVKRITIMLNGVSTSGSSVVQVQLGDTTIQTIGYASTTSTAGGSTSFSNTGLCIGGTSSSSSRNGIATICLLSGNTYVFNSLVSSENTQLNTGGGGVTISGVLDRIRITTVNGTDTFDAGQINITYEG